MTPTPSRKCHPHPMTRGLHMRLLALVVESEGPLLLRAIPTPMACICANPRTLQAGCLHTRPLALVPEPEGALLGTIPKGSDEFKRVAGEAARTIPGCGE